MARWTLKRLALAVPVVAGVTALTFLLIHLAPGDPIYLLAGDGGSPAYYADMRAKYGLDRSLWEQFLRYAAAVLTLDFGYSFMYQAPVARVLFQHLPATLLLGATALVLATCGGFAAGLASATVRFRAADAAVRVAASLVYAAPVFWTGQMLMLLVALRFELLPAGGMTTARETFTGLAHAGDVARHLVLPAVTLALPFAAVVTRITRAAVLDVLREPFIAATYARGVPRPRVLARHVVPLTLVPVVALVGQNGAQIAAGAALTEALFGWPGIGYLVLHASLHRDYPLVVAAFILISASVVVFNALTDAACAWLDPRMRQT